MKNLFKKDMRLFIRFLFMRLKIHLFFNKCMTNFILRLAYRSKLSHWINMHPSQEFNESEDCYENRANLYDFIFESESLHGEIDYLEFGVTAGFTLEWWVKKNRNPNSRFVGFDTFSGLPEDWDNIPKGTFTVNRELPKIEDNRISYEIGLFQDTLLGFLQHFSLNRRTVVHIDCDLYSASLFVLTALAPKLKEGDIIIFDEFGSIRHPTHEFRAFCDFITSYKFNYEVIGVSNFYYQVAIKVI